MKDFEIAAPGSLEGVFELLPRGRGAAGRVKLLAGGQDLLTEMKEHLVEPDLVVNLKRLEGLDRIELEHDGALSIGALARLVELEEHAGLARRHAVVAEAAGSIASPQIRSRATVGGNLCQRPRCWYYRNEDTVCIKKGGAECFSFAGRNKYNAILGGGPSYIVHPSDLAPALVASGASAVIAGREGLRTVELERFFTLPSEGSVLRENVLAADEVLVRVDVPAPAGEWRGTYLKFRERGSFDWALASVALRVRTEGRRVAEARVVLGGVAPIPWRSPEAEDVLTGAELSDEVARRAGEAALAQAEPLEENGYKVPLAKGLLRRAVARLASV